MTSNPQLVSIITPVYNSADFLSDTIKTVQSQTYDNWELILVDDKSLDDSVSIIKSYQKTEERIKLISLRVNSGAAIARNTGVESAKGRYVAFLDADDLWSEDKLMYQLNFMKKNRSAFSFTSYEFADEKGAPNGTKVHVPERITYRQALKNTTIWTSTVMFDIYTLSKKDISMPNVKRGQDTATWWKVLKIIDSAHGLNEVLSYYRRTDTSLSANKLKALKRTWHLYRTVENLGVMQSSWNFGWYCFNAIKRRI